MIPLRQGFGEQAPLRRTTATGGKLPFRQSFKYFVDGFIAVSFFLSVPCVHASGVGSAAGLTLLRASGARASALGEAFTGMEDDITALEFNPGSLATLTAGAASLQHQTGLNDDSFSKALVGWNMFGGGVGLSAGHYDSGRVNLYDGLTQKSVTAEQDWVTTMGYGRSFGKVATGASVRYLSSRLAESYSGSAVSMDAGIQIPFSERLRMGLSGPLVQTKLKYANVEESLTKVYRVGVAMDVPMNLPTGRLPLKLLLDTPYDSTARRVSVAMGAETRMGPLSFRAGYNNGSDVNNFSLGAGFAISQFTIDYSFGLVNTDFNSLHKISFSMRFGQGSKPTLALTSKNNSSPPLWTIKPEVSYDTQTQ